MGLNTKHQKGFTLLEVTIVIVIVSILLGFTVALIPKQQELRRYQEADREMDKIIDTLIGFAQVNGRLPCPASIASAGAENFTLDPTNCANHGGFVPVTTLGIEGRLNSATLLLDPWGNPYRYYISSSDANDDGDGDFTYVGQMQEIGLGDVWDISSDPDNPAVGTDNYIDLDGQFIICDAASTTVDICAGGANLVYGSPFGAKGPYAGAIVVLLSTGKNGNQTPDPTDNADELENMGATVVGQYFLKNNSTVLGTRETTFVKRTTGFADNFDDIVKWISPSTLFSKMIEADQLP